VGDRVVIAQMLRAKWYDYAMINLQITQWYARSASDGLQVKHINMIKLITDFATAMPKGTQLASTYCQQQRQALKRRVQRKTQQTSQQTQQYDHLNSDRALAVELQKLEAEVPDDSDIHESFSPPLQKPVQEPSATIDAEEAQRISEERWASGVEHLIAHDAARRKIESKASSSAALEEPTNASSKHSQSDSSS